jgi:hypothetical protein
MSLVYRLFLKGADNPVDLYTSRRTWNEYTWPGVRPKTVQMGSQSVELYFPTDIGPLVYLSTLPPAQSSDADPALATSPRRSYIPLSSLAGLFRLNLHTANLAGSAACNVYRVYFRDSPLHIDVYACSYFFTRAYIRPSLSNTAVAYYPELMVQFIGYGGMADITAIDPTDTLAIPIEGGSGYASNATYLPVANIRAIVNLNKPQVFDDTPSSGSSSGEIIGE